jgi:hypothetical protein
MFNIRTLDTNKVLLRLEFPLLYCYAECWLSFFYCYAACLLNVITLSVVFLMLCWAYAECNYTECRGAIFRAKKEKLTEPKMKRENSLLWNRMFKRTFNEILTLFLFSLSCHFYSIEDFDEFDFCKFLKQNQVSNVKKNFFFVSVTDASWEYDRGLRGLNLFQYCLMFVSQGICVPHRAIKQGSA